jgi:hypothetical protein
MDAKTAAMFRAHMRRLEAEDEIERALTILQKKQPAIIPYWNEVIVQFY